MSLNYDNVPNNNHHLSEVTSYLCFTTEVWRKRCYPFKNAFPPPNLVPWEKALGTWLPSTPLPTHQVKLQVLVFNIVWGWRVGGEVRQVIRIRRVRKSPKSFVHD